MRYYLVIRINISIFAVKICDIKHYFLSHNVQKRYVYTRKKQLNKLPLGHFASVTHSGECVPEVLKMKKIPIYKFNKHKYGDELLVDVIDFEPMLPDIRRTPVFSMTFYNIMLVLEGSDVISVNGRSRQIQRGLIICSIPGEVWEFPANPQLKVLNLIFEKESLLSFFNDPHFLDHFGYLQADRTTPFLKPDEATFERILSLYQEMKVEISNHSEKDQHILRAMLYGTMMLLQRVAMVGTETTETVGRTQTDIPVSRYVDDFVQLVSDHFHEEHGTEYYADRLCITSNYLNKIVRQSLGKSAKTYILDQILAEACRLLRYTTLSVSDIAAQLHFDTSTYFVRIFGKHVGQTPLKYREKSQSPEK